MYIFIYLLENEINKGNKPQCNVSYLCIVEYVFNSWSNLREIRSLLLNSLECSSSIQHILQQK